MTTSVGHPLWPRPQTEIKRRGLAALCRTPAKTLRGSPGTANPMRAERRFPVCAARRIPCSPLPQVRKEVRMAGQTSWLALAVLIVASSPVVVLWISGWLADRRYRVEERHVRCRLKGAELADCTVVREAQSGVAI